MIDDCDNMVGGADVVFEVMFAGCLLGGSKIFLEFFRDVSDFVLEILVGDFIVWEFDSLFDGMLVCRFKCFL